MPDPLSSGELAAFPCGRPSSRGLNRSTDLETKVVARDRIVLAVAAGHRWAHRRAVNPRELKGGRWISRASGSGMRAVAAAALAGVGVELDPTSLSPASKG
ncbi:MAG TPA: LysR substrate-binding domain-containing protein [Solirubrobacterales bacterium]|jgi:DNA-binding transcriptional LysR family regulator